jgi:hypothetical protein
VTPEEALSAKSRQKVSKNSYDVALGLMSEDDADGWRRIVDDHRFESYVQVADAMTLFLSEKYGSDHVVARGAIPRDT